MITILSATNRPNSNTDIVAQAYSDLLTSKGEANQLLSLAAIDLNSLILNAYQVNESLVAVEKKYLKDAKKIIVIAPEYNGSFPGIFKLFIDSCDIKSSWIHKKILLTGVANGRAGNLRGLDHLTGVFMYLNNHVHPNKLPISGVNGLINEGKLNDTNTLTAIEKQLSAYLAW
jgi:NAD(P)H-dependent FMN reductase